MDIKNIPIKQDKNPVKDSTTQVSAEEFNSIVDTVKKSVVNKLGTTTHNGELYITHKLAGGTDVLETQIPKATTSTPGIMSKDDKDKLDKLSPNYPLVSQTINGDSYNVATDENESLTIFAPTEAGSEGYILASTGSGAPQWIPQADIKAGDADHAINADNATKASQDSMGRVISDTYLTKEELGDIGTTAQEAKQIAEQASRDVAAQESTIADIQETIENISAGGGATNAASVTYNNAGGSLTSTNVQNALTEVAGRLDGLDTANSEAVKDDEISEVRHIVNGIEYKTIVPSGETNNMDFVAPTEAGTQGHILQSSGDKNTPPTWADPADFKVGNANNADNAAKLGNIEASKYVKKTDLTEATTSKAGLMSAADKTKLDNLSEGGEDPLEGYNLVSMTVNGDSFNVLSDSNEAPTIYTPTEEGWENAVLMADGNGMPYWADQTDLHVGSADSATNATSDGNGNNIVNTYATKTALNEVKELVGDRDATSERMGYAILDPNKTFAEQVTEENTIYEVRDEFGLGRIDYTATLDNKYDHYVNDVLKDSYYITNSYVTVEVGQIIRLPEGFVLFDSSKSNILGKEYSPSSNVSVYIATLQSELNAIGSACHYSIDPILKVPKNCVLKFEGGSLKNVTIVGDNSVITSTSKCLKEVYVLGTWNCTGEVKWWCETSGFVETSDVKNPIDVAKVDCTRDFQCALDSDFNNLCVDGLYYITSTLNLAKPKDIEMAGYTAGTYLRQHQKDLVGKTFVFTDKDITLLRIAPELLRNSTIDFSSRVSIKGGNFDASLATIYSSNCIEVDIREGRKLWGFEFDSGVWGAYTSWGVLPGGCGIKFLTDGNNGYATMVNIKGNVEWFGTGLYIVSGSKCWITDIALNGVISNCPTALTAGADMAVHASIQPRCFFTEKNNGHPLVEVLDKTVVIDGMIWDVGTTQTYNEIKYYANSSAIDIRGGNVILEGRVAHYYKGSTRITGNTEFLHDDYSMTDKEKAFTHEQLLFNALEGFLLKGGTCSINLKDSNGSSLSGLNILQDINRLFSYTGSRVELQLESYNPDDGRYVEIKLEGFGSNYSIIHDVTLFFDRPANTAPFAEYEIEWQYSNSSWNAYRTGIVQTKGYASGGQISEFSKVSTSCTAIIIRLKKISAPITLYKLIATSLKTFYDNYNPAFLPVSGGTVYGDTTFNKAKIETLEVTTLITDSEDTANYVPATTREVGKGSIYTLFNIQNNGNPICSYSMFMLSTAESTNPPKASLYVAEVVGFTGSTKLTLRKVWGSLDVEFVVYKKTDINANYIVCVDNTSATFYRMNCVFLDNSANASMLQKTIASVEEDGYSTYSFTMHNNKGATSARPSSTYITNGECYFDTDLGKPIWWNGSAWVDAMGATVTG